ncbi:MAG: hypothetical protein M3400_02740 [Actinomycetota bacterium]|nr:hypothetical protein [Actinomycetota bacterium]
MAHQVLLVRPWDQQMSGSGCCGRLGGLGDELGNEEDFAPQRCDMESMGVVYRALRSALSSDVEMTVVDPRNTVWLVPWLLRRGWARGLRGKMLLREVRRGTSTTAVVVDGRTVAWGQLPGTAQVVDLVLAELYGPQLRPGM